MEIFNIYFLESYTDAHWFCRDRLYFWLIVLLDLAISYI